MTDEKLESLRRAVEFGRQNGKKNLIVDLDCLVSLFDLRTAIAGRDELIRELVEALAELVSLNDIREQSGAAEVYLMRKIKAWDDARAVVVKAKEVMG